MKLALVAFSILTMANPKMIQIKNPIALELPRPTSASGPVQASVASNPEGDRVQLSFPPTGVTTKATEAEFTIRWHKDLKSKSELLIHAFGSSKLAESAKSVVTSLAAPSGTIVVIPPAPGGSETWVYVLAKDPKNGALRLGPLPDLTFNWKELKVDWPK